MEKNRAVTFSNNVHTFDLHQLAEQKKMSSESFFKSENFSITYPLFQNVYHWESKFRPVIVEWCAASSCSSAAIQKGKKYLLTLSCVLVRSQSVNVFHKQSTINVFNCE